MKMFAKLSTPFLVLISLSCAQPSVDNSADAFLASFSELCGKAFLGSVVSFDDVDAAIRNEALVMHVRECSDDEIRIPFHVGDDHSRTWILTQTDIGLRLKHDHRHEDGSEDAVTQYGGDGNMVSSTRAEFPVDDYSIDLFKREGLTASVTNVWAVEKAGEIFAYELAREGRFFRVEFDLSTPTETPPVPWGYEITMVKPD